MDYTSKGRDCSDLGIGWIVELDAVEYSNLLPHAAREGFGSICGAPGLVGVAERQLNCFDDHYLDTKTTNGLVTSGAIAYQTHT